ncbi:hypothetical protein CYMTET_43465 [Cymbomonas tetramitiformis]|uniref:Kinesin light chain n=1 Tax=Cymbomonas tetramitiformis TaxID=36881 RepID=A0AAE0C3S9_9CHLO|nr:hypothetical protein CYMTET_43465 [Cymbomonas tetramitiformis]
MALLLLRVLLRVPLQLRCAFRPRSKCLSWWCLVVLVVALVVLVVAALVARTIQIWPFYWTTKGGSTTAMGAIPRTTGGYRVGAGEAESRAWVRGRGMNLGKAKGGVRGAGANIALCYEGLGEQAQALVQYRHALELLEKSYGEDHPSVAVIFNNMPEAHSSFVITALLPSFVPRSILGVMIYPRDLHGGVIFGGVALGGGENAGAFQDEGNLEEARRYCERGLEIREKVYGPCHTEVAQSLSNLAVLSRLQGNFEEATRLLKRSLAIDEEKFGSEHPEVATGLNNLAVLLSAQGLYQVCNVRVTLITLGKYVLAVRYSMAHLPVFSFGPPQEADPLHRKALAIQQKALHAEHPKVARRMSNLAGTCAGDGGFEEARPLYFKAIALQQKALGSLHPDLGVPFMNLAAMLVVQGKSDEALPMYETCQELNEKLHGRESNKVAPVISHLAENLASLGQKEASDAMDLRSIQLQPTLEICPLPPIPLAANNDDPADDATAQTQEAHESLADDRVEAPAQMEASISAVPDEKVLSTKPSTPTSVAESSLSMMSSPALETCAGSDTV